MAGIPAPLMALRGRPALWRAIRALARRDGGFDLDSLRRAAGGAAPDTAADYLRGLTRAGYLTVAGSGADRRWTLVNDCGAEAPRVDRAGRVSAAATGRDQLWRAMKMRAEFTPFDLTVGTAPPVAEATAAEYCQRLAKAGYLAVVQPGRPGHRPGGGGKARYRLLPSRVTGPAAPQIMRCKAIWDPNIEAVVALEPEKGDAP